MFWDSITQLIYQVKKKVRSNFLQELFVVKTQFIVNKALVFSFGGVFLQALSLYRLIFHVLRFQIAHNKFDKKRYLPHRGQEWKPVKRERENQIQRHIECSICQQTSSAARSPSCEVQMQSSRRPSCLLNGRNGIPLKSTGKTTEHCQQHFYKMPPFVHMYTYYIT